MKNIVGILLVAIVVMVGLKNLDNLVLAYSEDQRAHHNYLADQYCSTERVDLPSTRIGFLEYGFEARSRRMYSSNEWINYEYSYDLFDMLGDMFY